MGGYKPYFGGISNQSAEYLAERNRFPSGRVVMFYEIYIQPVKIRTAYGILFRSVEMAT